MSKRKMKDSGVEWLGEIPAEWDLVPARNLFSEVKDKNIDGKVTRQFSFRYGKIVDKDKSGRSDVTTDETITAYRIVTPDTIMINGLNLNYDFISQRVAIVEERGIITSAYLALCPNKKLIEPAFAVYLFKGYDSKQVFHGHGSGIRKTLNYSDFKEIKTVCPDLSTQRKIAAYLDVRCAKIDEMISDAKKSIEEYKAWKASVIFESVTGKNTGSKMKDSGVEWIGQVPEGWMLSKIGKVARTSSGATPFRGNESEYFDNATIRWVKTLDLNDGFVFDTEEKITEFALRSSSCKVMPVDTVMVAMYGGSGTIGKCGILKRASATNQAVCSIITERKLVDPYYLLNYLYAIKGSWMYFAVGTRKDPNINQQIVNQMSLPVPPLSEQRRIVDYLGLKCTAIDRVIAEKEALIADLEAYKKSLIFECVTGKMEVA